MKLKKIFQLAFILGVTHPLIAFPSVPQQLASIRAQVVEVEESLLRSLKENEDAKGTLKKIQFLLSLQKKENQLNQRRIEELQATVYGLEGRRNILRDQIDQERSVVRRSLIELHQIGRIPLQAQTVLEEEKIEQPRSKLLGHLTEWGLREIQMLKFDLQDADALETKISEERSALEAMVHELAENASVLEMNQQLQIDLIKKTHQKRIEQLEKYKALKASEARVSDLIKKFNARMELQESVRVEKSNQRAMIAMSHSEFIKQKGHLPLPIAGKIIGSFGKSLDSQSQLTVFKKGIDIEAGSNEPIRSVFNGKIAYTGDLNHYGKTVIVDHGDHFYSLYARVGKMTKKVGDTVGAKEEIARSDDSGSPVYFEIRARNIPVNPLQWVSK